MSREAAVILHVDDDEAIREVVGLVLQTFGGFKVISADGGRAGAREATERLPDLVLLDVMMPDMDGPCTLKALRADPRTSGIPVVFLTAKVLRRDMDKLRGLGAADIIEKPFGARKLVDALTAVLAMSRG